MCLPLLALSTMLAVAPSFAEPIERSDPPQIAGTWIGSAHILANWTSTTALQVRLNIADDGQVSGSIGDARISSGRVTTTSNRAKAFDRYSVFTVKLELQGPLLASDGITRGKFDLQLETSHEMLTGFGASNGNKSWPGASRSSRIRSAKIQVTGLELHKQ